MGLGHLVCCCMQVWVHITVCLSAVCVSMHLDVDLEACLLPRKEENEWVRILQWHLLSCRKQPREMFPTNLASEKEIRQPHRDGKRRGRHLLFPSLSLAPEPARVGPLSFLGQGDGLILRLGSRWPDMRFNERNRRQPSSMHASSCWRGGRVGEQEEV